MKKITIAIACIALLSASCWFSTSQRPANSGPAVPYTVTPQTSQTNPTSMDTYGNQTITLKQFFPDVSGDLGNISVSIPAGYQEFNIAEMSGYYYWGTSQDIKAVSTDSNNGLDYTKAKDGIFWLTSTGFVTVDSSGHFTDPNGIMDAEGLAKQGITGAQIKQGFLGGVKTYPVLTVKGIKGGVPVFKTFIISPDDNEAIEIDLRGGSNSSNNDKVWNQFIASLKISQ